MQRALHVTIPVRNDAEVETLVDRIALEASAMDIDQIAYHVHEHEDGPAQSGTIVGWKVVTPPQERDFYTHGEALAYANRKGGDVYPIFEEEVAVV